jgi:peptidoglycan/LPS O-acetylase OafA/YrhL
VYFGFISKLDTFAFGMLLALVVAVIPRSFKLPRSLALGLRLGGFGLMLATFAWRETNSFIWLYFHTLCGLAFLRILASTVLSPKKTVWGNFLALPALQFLGLISYSLYMWHEPILIDLSDRFAVSFETPNLFILSTALFLGISVIAAGLSYWGLERPATFLQRFFNRQGRMVERYPDQQRPLKGL